MNKIYVILGKSSSGKDTIMKELSKKMNLNPIVYYTTRPMRDGEKDGVEYFFLKNLAPCELGRFNLHLQDVIEKREYITQSGKWAYFTAVNECFNSEKDGIIVLPPDAYRKWAVSSLLEKYELIPIYIYVKDDVRLIRAINREKNEENPSYIEVCRRFIADEKDFEDFKPKFIFENNDVESCISEIIKTIKN